MPDRVQWPFDPIAEARRQWVDHGWGAAAPAMAVVTSIMRVQQVFLGRADAVLRPFNLTFSRYEVLMLLLFTQRGSLPLGKIGERLQVKAGSVTNAVDRLEVTGLVRRMPNPRDGRGTLAAITTEGRRVANLATAAMNSGLFDDVGMSAAGLAELFESLRALRLAAGDFGGSGVDDTLTLK